MRAPSSLYSTLTSAPELGERGVEGLGRARRASAGPGGRPRSATASSAAAPPVSASRAVSRQPPGEHERPAHRGRRDLGGGRDRLQHHALQRALAQLAGEQPPQERAARRRWPRRTGRRAGRRGGPWSPAPEVAASSSSARLDVGDLQDRRRRPAARPAPASVRQPAPIRPCRGSPASHAVAGSISSGAAARSSAASAAVFAVRERVAPTAAEVATTSASSTVSVIQDGAATMLGHAATRGRALLTCIGLPAVEGLRAGCRRGPRAVRSRRRCAANARRRAGSPRHRRAANQGASGSRVARRCERRRSGPAPPHRDAAAPPRSYRGAADRRASRPRRMTKPSACSAQLSSRSPPSLAGPSSIDSRPSSARSP